MYCGASQSIAKAMCVVTIEGATKTTWQVVEVVYGSWKIEKGEQGEVPGKLIFDYQCSQPDRASTIIRDELIKYSITVQKLQGARKWLPVLENNSRHDFTHTSRHTTDLRPWKRMQRNPLQPERLFITARSLPFLATLPYLDSPCTSLKLPPPRPQPSTRRHFYVPESSTSQSQIKSEHRRRSACLPTHKDPRLQTQGPARNHLGQGHQCDGSRREAHEKDQRHVERENGLLHFAACGHRAIDPAVKWVVQRADCPAHEVVACGKRTGNPQTLSFRQRWC